MCPVINELFEGELGDEWGLRALGDFIVGVWVVADTL